MCTHHDNNLLDDAPEGVLIPEVQHQHLDGVVQCRVEGGAHDVHLSHDHDGEPPDAVVLGRDVGTKRR